MKFFTKSLGFPAGRSDRPFPCSGISWLISKCESLARRATLPGLVGSNIRESARRERTRRASRSQHYQQASNAINSSPNIVRVRGCSLGADADVVDGKTTELLICTADEVDLDQNILANRLGDDIEAKVNPV